MSSNLMSSMLSPALVLSIAVATGGMASAACGQVSYELRTRVALGWGEEAVPIDEELQITAPGRYDFEFQEGVFNAQGFTNFGLLNWIGQVRSSEPGLSRPDPARVAPFRTLGGFDGALSEDTTQIGLPGVYPDSNRHRYIDAAWLWQVSYFNEGDPIPPPPEPYGAEEYVPVYRFSLMITDLTPRDIELRVEDTGQSRPSQGWMYRSHVDPDPETGAPGYVRYDPWPIDAQDAQPALVTLATLQIVPGPSALGCIALGLTLSRRRR